MKMFTHTCCLDVFITIFRPVCYDFWSHMNSLVFCLQNTGDGEHSFTNAYHVPKTLSANVTNWYGTIDCNGQRGQHTLVCSFHLHFLQLSFHCRHRLDVLQIRVWQNVHHPEQSMLNAWIQIVSYEILIGQFGNFLAAKDGDTRQIHNYIEFYNRTWR